MAASESVSNRSSNAPISEARSPSTIYESPGKPASKPDGRLTRAATSSMVATALWLVVSELGVPQIAGLGHFELFFPFAIVGALIGLTRLRRVLVWVTALFVALMMLIANTDLISDPVESLIRTDPVPPRADAIVVLSAGVTPDGMLQQQSLDRLLKGVELARSGVSGRLVVTRERKRLGNGYVTSEADQNRIIGLGGGLEVITTGLVASTRDEALRVHELSRKAGWTRVVLVTSPFHSRRACATFEKAGLTVSCVPSDSRDIAVKTLAGGNNRVRAFAMWIYELAGTLRYRVAGWM